MKVDVAVIGAGPSGAFAACLLARGGARVLLFDPSHPREKPCGGGITGRALALVAGVLAVDDIPAVRVRTARFVDTAGCRATTVSAPARAADSAVVALRAGGQTGVGPRPDPDTALMVASREGFDGRLLDAACRAGAEHIAGRVRRVADAGGAFRLETADGHVHTASQVIGADGANSLARRRFASAFRRDQLSIATGFFAHGVTSDEVVIELMSDPPGYFWSFPRPDHLAVGICAQANAGVEVSALRSLCRDWIRRLHLADTAQLEPYSWPIPSLASADFRTLDAAGTGWYLVGDAAGLVDPITREGIFFALQSGQFAADAILGGSARAGRTYNDRVRREIATDLARAARLKTAFFQPGFTQLMVPSLARSGRIRAVMADLIAGAQSYRGLKWRLARTMEVGVAWRLLQSMR